jgi:hypothetical protein
MDHELSPGEMNANGRRAAGGGGRKREKNGREQTAWKGVVLRAEGGLVGEEIVTGRTIENDRNVNVNAKFTSNYL